MARPDFSEATEDEVKSLFDEDGPLEEPTDVEDDSVAEDSEAEGGQEEEEADAPDRDDEEEDSDEEESAEATWEEAPAALRTEFETVQGERDRWKRDYGKLQSKFTERVNAFKEEERSLPQLRVKSEALDRWNSLLGQYPQLQQTIEREVARLQNPMAAVEIPKGLENDPAVQYAKKLVESQTNYTRSLEAKVREFQATAGKVSGWENQQKDAQARQRLDGLLDEAKSEIKSMFGRDATEQEVTQVLQYMTQKNYFESGATAAFHLFRDQYKKLSTRVSDEKLREKSKKFPVRSKGISPARGKSRDAESPEEALAMAFADQGFGN